MGHYGDGALWRWGVMTMGHYDEWVLWRWGIMAMGHYDEWGIMTNGCFGNGASTLDSLRILGPNPTCTKKGAIFFNF